MITRDRVIVVLFLGVMVALGFGLASLQVLPLFACRRWSAASGCTEGRVHVGISSIRMSTALRLVSCCEGA